MPRFPSHLSLLSLLVMAWVAPAGADILLAPPADPLARSSGTRYVLEYTSRDPDGTRAGRPIREDRSFLFPDAPVDQVWIEGYSPDMGIEGALLALGESFDPQEWHVEVQPLELAPANDGPAHEVDATACVDLAPIQLGTFQGFRVTIDPGRAVDSDGRPVRLARARLILSGPPMSQPAVRASHPDHPGFALARSVFLNHEEIRTVPTASGRLLRSETMELPAPAGEWRATYRTGEGIMRIHLATIGASPDDGSALRVVHHGQALPLGGTLGGDLWVYAPRRHTLDDRTDSLFLTLSAETPSPAMQARPSFVSLVPEPTEVALPRHRVFRQRAVYERFLPIPLGTRFAWYRVQNPAGGGTPSSRTLVLEVADRVTQSEVTLSAAIHGYNGIVGLEFDHFADLILEGTPASRAQWKGRVLHEFSDSLTIDPIPQSATWTLQHLVPGGTPATAAGIDIQFADHFALSWTGYPRLQSDSQTVVELHGTEDPRRVTVGGFPPSSQPGDVVVLEISDPTSPVRVLVRAEDLFLNSDGTMTVQWESPGPPARYHVAYLPVAEEPLTLVESERLPAAPDGTMTLVGVYVRPPGYAGAIQPLLQLRAGEDGVILELDPQAAYNAYNGGQESPDAIRDALRDLIAAAPQRAVFPDVILFGHGTLDPRDYLGQITAPQIPTFRELSVVTNGSQIENNIDFPYAQLFGDDLLPDVRLSRVHPLTLAELETAVERIIAHDSVAEDLRGRQRPALFIADEQKGADDFPLDQPLYIAPWEQVPGRTAIRIDRPDFANLGAMYQQVRATMSSNDGMAFVMYTGHGFNNQWAGSQMLTSARVPEIDTHGRWPLVATFTCLNAYFALPGSTVRSLSEAWLFARDNQDRAVGAVANIAPVSVDFYTPQKVFALEILDGFRQRPDRHPETVGDLFLRGQIQFATKYPFWEKTLREYILFGDPATDLGVLLPETTIVSDWWMLN